MNNLTIHFSKLKPKKAKIMKQTDTVVANGSKQPLIKYSPLKAIQLTFAATEAREVFIAGDFNQWDPKSTPMHRDARGVWKRQLRLSPGGHEYRLVVDGQWQDDPHAAASIANPYGGNNSFVQVG